MRRPGIITSIPVLSDFGYSYNTHLLHHLMGGNLDGFSVGQRADAFEEIARMAAGVVDVFAAQGGGLAGDLRRIGVELVAMHDDLALAADEVPAAVCH